MFLTSSASAGMSPEEVKALKVYKAKAAKGDPVAQFNLGNCYRTGKGVAKDMVEAYAFFNLAGITEEIPRKAADYLEKKLSPEAVLRGRQRTKELQKEIDAKIAANKVAQ